MNAATKPTMTRNQTKRVARLNLTRVGVTSSAIPMWMVRGPLPKIAVLGPSKFAEPELVKLQTGVISSSH